MDWKIRWRRHEIWSSKLKFSAKEKQALIELKKYLSSVKKLNEKDLFNEFYEICEKIKIKNTDFFKVAYLAILNKPKGPRLVNLILMIGKEKLIKLLNTIR